MCTTCYSYPDGREYAQRGGKGEGLVFVQWNKTEDRPVVWKKPKYISNQPT